jgi:hypothetical protein
MQTFSIAVGQWTVPEPEEGQAPLSVAPGDILYFSTDEDNYAICVLTVSHPDDSLHWIEFNRNGDFINSGYAAGPSEPEEPPVEPEPEPEEPPVEPEPETR